MESRMLERDFESFATDHHIPQDLNGLGITFALAWLVDLAGRWGGYQLSKCIWLFYLHPPGYLQHVVLCDR